MTTPALDLAATEETAGLTPRGAHLVGSVNLETAAETFQMAAERLGTRLRRIPDGEVGERFYWISFQGLRFDAVAGLSRIPIDPIMVGGFDFRPLALDGTVAAADLVFGELGYAAAATSSYGEFVRLREAGVIAPGTRFQVSLPTPLACVVVFVVPDDREAVYPVYEAALLREIEAIRVAIPAEDLAIQLDVAVELAVIEGATLGASPEAPWFDDALAGSVERIVGVASTLPDDVELGFHLCYGDVAEKHFMEPADTTNLVAVANGLAAGLTRRIDWIHLPVPIERDDVAYFAPLAGLALDAATELYLGLIHHEDGVEGARRRIAAATQALNGREFGVGTECGFGRGPRDRTAGLLDQHAALAAAW